MNHPDSSATAEMPWWEVWISEDDSRKLVLQASDAEQAATKALEGAKLEAVIEEVSPTVDPVRLQEAVHKAVGEAHDWLSDMIEMDLPDLRDGGSFGEMMSLDGVLPDCFASHYTPELVEQFAQTVEVTAAKLARYPDTYLASTAEELAAHALLSAAEADLRERATEDEDSDPLILAAAIEQIEEMHEDAFEDWDVLMLFEAQFDGLESSDIASEMGMANLHPRDWFTPFRAGEL